MLQVILISCSISLLLGFSSGYALRNLQSEAEKAKLLVKDRKILEENDKTNKELSLKLENLEKTRATKTKIVIKKVPMYVTKYKKIDSVCNLSKHTKQLLNSYIKDM